MDTATPYADLMPGLEGSVLEVLAGTTRALTGRQVQRLARRGAVSGVAATLDRLVTSGLVLAQPAGRAILYHGNREHLAWPVVEAAVGLRRSLLRRLADTIAGWTIQPRQATLFGSTARGDGGVESDIDLLLIHSEPASKDWDDQVDRFRIQIPSWTGNNAQIVDLDFQTWQQMAADSDPLVDSIRADGIDVMSTTWRSA